MKALLLVDIQNDFLPGGALPVPQGDAVITPVNQLLREFHVAVATQDWHPPNHGSFAMNHPGRRVFEEVLLNGLPQTLWPAHCVQNTWGAELAPDLDRNRIQEVFQKGVEAEIDSYSGFFDNGHRRSTGLGDWLKQRGVTDVIVCGLATDYCVKFTALDAVQLGFKTTVVEDACRGVNVRAEDSARALEEMRQAGVNLARTSDFIQL